MNGIHEEVGSQRDLQEVVKSMFTSVTPERAEELERFWAEFSPRFNILEDDGPDGPLVMDAGGYVWIRFNHRIMRLFWLASFALWEGYRAYHHYAESGETDVGRFREVVDCFEATRTAENVDDVNWPEYLPKPGELVDHTPGNPARVGGELAIFAVSWAVLHELRHLIHQQEGTSAHGDDEAHRQEELSCDAFATEFLLEKIGDYSRNSEQDKSLVAAKRQTGIYCALFALTLLSRECWGESDTHPAIQTRIDNVLRIVDACGMSRLAAVIAISAFSTLKLAYPDAPDPERAVGEVAIRENWNPDDGLF